MDQADIERAAVALASGGVCVYPTETLYALGAAADLASAVARVAALKGRPSAKPLPLLIGSMAQIWDVVPPDFRDSPLFPDFERLSVRFWPGPLSLVLPCRAEYPGLVKDALGRSSARFTPHPVAAALCRLAGRPLLATSANRSGQPAAAVAGDLDPTLLGQVDAALTGPPGPGGGPPSTVVAVLGQGRLEMVRQGAVEAARLVEAGFTIGV